MKTDDELRREVEEELELEPSIDHRQIAIAVKDGIATLAGEVRSYSEKWKAERAVERIAGIRGIANEIEVRLTSERSDVDIARTAVNILDWNTLVPSDRIKVEVRKGWVTLTGEVNYDFERRAAEHAVRDLWGVRGVSNLITIRPRVAPTDVKKEIQRTFQRDAVLDAQNVTVEVKDGEVTLLGSVRSWAERHEAERAALRAPGVTSVKNYITVRPEVAYAA
jgi:osmotically-inducible protein OsmY